MYGNLASELGRSSLLAGEPLQGKAKSL